MLNINFSAYGLAGALDQRQSLDYMRQAGDKAADSSKLDSAKKLRPDQQKATGKGINGLGGKLDVSV